LTDIGVRAEMTSFHFISPSALCFRVFEGLLVLLFLSQQRVLDYLQLLARLDGRKIRELQNVLAGLLLLRILRRGELLPFIEEMLR
jgi:hypothetical protein